MYKPRQKWMSHNTHNSHSLNISHSFRQDSYCGQCLNISHLYGQDGQKNLCLNINHSFGQESRTVIHLVNIFKRIISH